MRKKQTPVEEVATSDVAALPQDVENIKVFLEEILRRMNLCECSVRATTDGEVILLNIDGEDTAALIGHHGEVLDALQYLCSLMLNGKSEGFRRIVLDTNDYRNKREKALQHLAKNLEAKVKRTGRSCKLEPMNPYERRIIHTTLQDSAYVTTESEGQGNTRHVVVSPKSQSNILNTPTAPRKTLNFVYRSEKKRR